MQITQFINDLIPIMDACGKCHKFGSIIQDRSTLDAFNVTDDNKCCNVLFIEGYRVIPNYSPKIIAGATRQEREYCDHVFNLLVLEQSRADLQLNNETSEYPIDESRWNEYIQPKIDCLGCFEFEPCSNLDKRYQVAKWKIFPEYNVSSHFFDGIRIEAIIRQYG